MTRLFDAVLGKLENHTPGWIRSLEIQILFNTTAEGFGEKTKRVWTLPPEKALYEYAAFTKACMERGEADTKALFHASKRTGENVRKILRLSGREESQRLVFYLYRNIGISMTGHLPGEVRVSKCYFAETYTPSQCLVMSAVDSGIVSGICGGGALLFTERITEGCRECRAIYEVD